MALTGGARLLVEEGIEYGDGLPHGVRRERAMAAAHTRWSMESVVSLAEA